jgi:stage III sporulation protein AF
MQLLPDARFAGYVRFYAGIIFILLAIRPVLQIFGENGTLEHLLQVQLLKTDYQEAEEAIRSMDEMKNEKIQNAYEDELRRQIRELLGTWQISEKEIVLTFDPEESTQITAVRLVLEMPPDTDHADDTVQSERLQQELASLFSISEAQIQIDWQEDTDAELGS